MATTVHTSVGVRDITKAAIDIVCDDPIFKGWRNDSLEELTTTTAFHTQLGKALAAKIDWTEVRFRRAHPKRKTKKVA